MKVQSINNIAFLATKKRQKTNVTKEQYPIKQKNDDTISTPKILAMIAGIMGLTALLYVLPNRSSKEIIQKATDSIMEKKPVVSDTIKDTLNLFI